MGSFGGESGTGARFSRVLRFSPVILLLYLGQAVEAMEPSNKAVLRWMSENIEQQGTVSVRCYTFI